MEGPVGDGPPGALYLEGTFDLCLPLLCRLVAVVFVAVDRAVAEAVDDAVDDAVEAGPVVDAPAPFARPGVVPREPVPAGRVDGPLLLADDRLTFVDRPLDVAIRGQRLLAATGAVIQPSGDVEREPGLVVGGGPPFVAAPGVVGGEGRLGPDEEGAVADREPRVGGRPLDVDRPVQCRLAGRWAGVWIVQVPAEVVAVRAGPLAGAGPPVRRDVSLPGVPALALVTPREGARDCETDRSNRRSPGDSGRHTSRGGGLRYKISLASEQLTGAVACENGRITGVDRSSILPGEIDTVTSWIPRYGSHRRSRWSAREHLASPTTSTASASPPRRARTSARPWGATTPPGTRCGSTSCSGS